MAAIRLSKLRKQFGQVAAVRERLSRGQMCGDHVFVSLPEPHGTASEGERRVFGCYLGNGLEQRVLVVRDRLSRVG